MNRTGEKVTLITYEKALFIQADLRIVRRSTIERKQMSTKTTFKRIALVAVAALGLGVLSVAPSSAAVGTISVAAVQQGAPALDSTALLGAETATAAIFTVSALITNSDSVTVSFIPTGTDPTGSVVSPVLTLLDSSSAQTGQLFTNGKVRAYSSAAADSVTARTDIVESVSGTNVLGAKFALYLDSNTPSTRKAGTYNYLVVVKAYQNGGASINDALTQTLPITLVIAADATASKTPSAVTSFANLNSAAAASQAAVGTDAVISKVSTAGTAAGFIYVGNRNAKNGIITAQDSLTATITGAGVVCSNTGTLAAPVAGICGKSIKVNASAGDYEFVLQADGTAGSSTVVVSASVAGWSSTKTLSFYAKAAKTLTASVFTPILGVGSNDSAVVVTAVDSNGTNWSGTAYIVATAAADALIGGSATTPVPCVASTDGTKQYCPVSTISTGTANFTVIDASTVALATATSNAIAVKVSNAAAATVKIAFDKATYAPFEKAIITVTPLDSSGNTIAAVSGSYLAAALTSNVALTVPGGATATLPGASAITTRAYAGPDATAGSLSYVVYMPAAAGTVTLTGKGGAALPLAGQVAVTASATVVNASVDAATDAANEATDAANAATDAALAAADAADAATAAAQDASDAVAALSASVEKLVASLKAQLTSLTNLVIKIQKKVKA